MTNYDEMTNRELYQVIAESKGYYVKTLVTHDIALFVTLCSPNHAELITFEKIGDIDTILENPLRWALDRAWFQPVLPQWSTDANATLGLLAEMNEQSGFDLNKDAFSLVPSNAKSEVVFNEYKLGISSVFASAPTAAEAIARAYLKWKAGQDD